MIILAVIASVVGLIALAFLFLTLFYVVVNPNQAHVVVFMGKGRKVYSPSKVSLEDQKNKELSKSYSTAYFYLPILMKRIIVSLENVKHEINEIILKDVNVAPFKCDITCWFKIQDPDLAAEKLDVDADGSIVESVRETLNAQIQGVARAAAMEQEVIDLMRNRKVFSDSVYKEVNGDLDDWGIQLVKLEIIDFSDTDESHVIKDYEKRREAVIESKTRIEVAEQTQLAEVKEAEARKLSEEARIHTQQEIQMKEVDMMQTVDTRKAEARIKVAEQLEKANDKEVKAKKTEIVGRASYEAEAAEIIAKGRAQAQVKEAEGQSQGITLLAKADAEKIRSLGKAEAEAVSHKAEAQQKFTDVSKDIEMAKIVADLEKSKYASMADSMSNAKLNIVSPDMNFMGFGAKEGAGLGALAEALQATAGVNISDLVSSIADKIEAK